MSIIGELFRITNGEWTQEALCREVGETNLWFPDKGESSREARRVCLGCPVRVECLQYALDNNEHWGIFGGFTERDRKKLMRGVNPIHTSVPRPAPLRVNGHGIACRCTECRRGVA